MKVLQYFYLQEFVLNIYLDGYSVPYTYTFTMNGGNVFGKTGEYLGTTLDFYSTLYDKIPTYYINTI